MQLRTFSEINLLMMTMIQWKYWARFDFLSTRDRRTAFRQELITLVAEKGLRQVLEAPKLSFAALRPTLTTHCVQSHGQRCQARRSDAACEVFCSDWPLTVTRCRPSKQQVRRGIRRWRRTTHSAIWRTYTYHNYKQPLITWNIGEVRPRES